jgi:hypothetical protein
MKRRAEILKYSPHFFRGHNLGKVRNSIAVLFKSSLKTVGAFLLKWNFRSVPLDCFRKNQVSAARGSYAKFTNKEPHNLIVCTFFFFATHGDFKKKNL